MNQIKVTTKEHKGYKFDVLVNEDGEFSVTIGDVQITGDTINVVVEKVEKQLKTKDKKINIRAAHWNSHYGMDKVVTGSFTGIHAGTGNYLFKPDNEKGVDQIWESSARDSFIPENFADEYGVLCQAVIQASKIRNAFLTKHAVNYGKLVREALGKDTDEIV